MQRVDAKHFPKINELLKPAVAPQGATYQEAKGMFAGEPVFKKKD